MLLAAALAVACTPALVDGGYACEDGQCPPGWVCRGDLRCYVTQAALEVPCRTADDCASGACSIAIAGSSAGYCTLECTNDAGCNELGGGARCVLERCLVPCSDRTECPTGSDCQLPHQAMTEPPTAGSCSQIDDPAFSGATGCPRFADCQPPGFCLASTDASMGTTGVCSMWCSDDAHCPAGPCVALLRDPRGGMIRHCLASCFPAGTTCANGLECGRLLGADAPPGQVCIPAEWDGQTLPLPGDLAMPR